MQVLQDCVLLRNKVVLLMGFGLPEAYGGFVEETKNKAVVITITGIDKVILSPIRSELNPKTI